MKTILRSQDLTCPSCTGRIEKSLKACDGVHDARVYFSTGRIEVQHDPGRATADDLIKAVRMAGYTATTGTLR